MALFLKEEKQHGGLPSPLNPRCVAYIYVSEGSFHIEKYAFSLGYFLLHHKFTAVHYKKLYHKHMNYNNLHLFYAWTCENHPLGLRVKPSSLEALSKECTFHGYIHKHTHFVTYNIYYYQLWQMFHEMIWKNNPHFWIKKLLSFTRWHVYADCLRWKCTIVA